MPALDDPHLIADPKNGVVTPIYFDRQVVRASDLTLDRESHDAALARMRRLMHGTGIVSGFIPDSDGDSVFLSAGYAVAPSGAEIFMPDDIELDQMFDRIMKTCGPGSPGCELISDAAKSQALAEVALASVSVGAWLVARPISDETDPRPAVPEGCAHPGNLQLATRRCHMVQLELMCTLPSDKVTLPPRCSLHDPFVCAEPETGITRPVPYPGAPGGEEDFVVIGYAALTENGVQVHLQHRRTVLPTSYLQNWMQSCLCPIVHAPQVVIVDETTPDTPPDDSTEPDTPSSSTNWGKWDRYLYGNVEVADGVKGHLRPAEELAEQIPYLAGELDRLAKFPDLGIDGPETFLETDVATLVTQTGLPGGTILQMKEELLATSQRWSAGDGVTAVSSSWSEFNTKMSDAGVSTAWATSDSAPATGSTSTPPLVTAIVGSQQDLEAKGINGPADMLGKTDAELGVALGVSAIEARAIKTDMMRFVPIMAKGG